MVVIQNIFCFRLSSFALVWGWLGAIFSVLGFILGSVSLYMYYSENIWDAVAVRSFEILRYGKCRNSYLYIKMKI